MGLGSGQRMLAAIGTRYHYGFSTSLTTPMPRSAPAGPSRLLRSRRLFLKGSLAAALPSVLGARLATASSPLTSVVVPHEAGGGMDLLARQLVAGLVAQGISPTVVLNRPGASGLVGTASVARGKGDGSVLLFNGVGHLTTPLLHREKHYDPIEDFDGVLTIGKSPNVLMIHGKVAGDPASLIRGSAKGEPYASSAVGSTPHLAAELFMSRARLEWLHVPYKGTGPALRALMAGEVKWMFVPSSSAASAAESGRVRALAVAHARRLPSLPDVPTLRELGFGDVELSQWYALFAPSGVARARRETLAQAARRVVSTPTFTGYMAQQSIERFSLELDEMDKWLKKEYASLKTLVESLGLLPKE